MVSTNEYHITTVRLTKEQFERMRELARRNHRAVSGELRVAIEKHLAVADSERAGASLTAT